MLDTNSTDTPLSENSQRLQDSLSEDVQHVQQFLRRYHGSFSTGDPALDRILHHLRADAVRSIARLEELATPTSRSRQSRAPATEVMTTPPTSGDNTAAAPAPAQQKPKKPVTTLVSMLPKTAYNEVEEAEGTVRSPAYVRVQRQLLYWLSLRASDTLDIRQAHIWTEKIAEDKHPQAKDALRLCYYMRSQGFDTYAVFRESFMSLYIVNQNTDVRGPEKDMMYWHQNFVNNDIAHEVHDEAETSGARGGRRNAFTSDLTNQELLAHLSAAGTASNRARFADDLAAAAQDGHGEEAGNRVGPVGEQDQEHVGRDGEPTQDSLAARVAIATGELEVLLLSNFPDAAAIDAAIARVAELNSQGN